jgi:hypothetical protein
LGPRIGRVREHFVEVMRRRQASGQLPPDTDPAEAAQVMMGLIPGFILQRLMLGDVTLTGFTRGVHGLIDG